MDASTEGLVWRHLSGAEFQHANLARGIDPKKGLQSAVVHCLVVRNAFVQIYLQDRLMAWERQSVSRRDCLGPRVGPFFFPRADACIVMGQRSTRNGSRRRTGVAGSAQTPCTMSKFDCVDTPEIASRCLQMKTLPVRT